MADKKKAVVLISGGLDSATTLALARQRGFACFAMTFRYGQRHSVEIDAACRIAASLGAIEHRIIDIDLARFGASALTDKSIAVPKDRPSLGNKAEIPVTYVPARNLIFLGLALAWSEVIGAFDIFIGVNVTDYSGYPDCRGEFLSSFENTANLATAASAAGGHFTIHAPLLDMSKSQIILAGIKLGVDFALTHSCYVPDEKGRPCGHCDSCRLRLKGFSQAGIKDPLEYADCS